MSASGKALVVGAGIVGAACADELARAGFAVTVLDAASPGGGATAAGMGHVLVLDDSEAQLALTRLSRQLWRELAPSLPPNTDVSHNGTLWIAEDDEELEAARTKHAWYAEREVVTELLDATQLREHEANLSEHLVGALRVPDDLIVYPPLAAEALLARSGAELRCPTRVRLAKERSVELVDGTLLEADLVVLAAGEHALELLPAPLPSARVRSRKGHLVITESAPGFAHHQIVELGYLKSAHSHDGSSVAFNMQPRPNGQLLIGSSRQYDRTSDEVEHEMIARMFERAFHYAPRLQELRALRAWTGRRAATDDHLPLIGRTPQGGPWLAAGHEGLGITTSLGSAKLLVDLALERTPCLDPTPFAPNRIVPEPAHA